MIPPGSGHPRDHADAATPVARTADDVARLARSAGSLDELDGCSSVCRACPRLVTWREEVAVLKRASYADEQYWGRPITGWGPADARIAVVGLAPAAHGGNRTGRIFTGDRSGDWLFAALHRVGLATQPTSISAYDEQSLLDVRITLPVRCAPPANKPTPAERDTCAPWLAAEWRFLQPTVRAVVVLGGYGWAALWPTLRRADEAVPSPVPRFGHGAEVRLPSGLTVLGCFHVSQQNTFTGRLTEPMLDAVLLRAVELSGGGTRPHDRLRRPVNLSESAKRVNLVGKLWQLPPLSASSSGQTGGSTHMVLGTSPDGASGGGQVEVDLMRGTVWS